MKRIESVQLGDRTIAAIRSAIISGELPPGRPLLDRHLAEELGVSRTPVREALHRLEAAGLVQSRGRSGWVVSPFTESDVRELFQLRMILEPVGLDQLAAQPEEDRIAELTRFFSDYEQPIPPARYTEYFAHDDSFHQAIVACSGNGRLRGFYSVMNAHINRGRFFLIGATAGRVDETLEEHRAIISGVAARDFPAARAALLEHLKTGEELMLRQLRAESTHLMEDA